MSRPIIIGVQSGTKLLRIERDEEERAWIVWLSANRTFTCGTMLMLYDSGELERIITDPDGTEQRITIRKAEL